MRNLSKVNKKNKHMKMSRRIGRSLITGACSAILFSGMAAVPAMAEAVDPAEAISIEKPSGWKQGSTDVHITVDGSHLGEGVSVAKVEAKVGEGSWQDVTAGMAVTINTNTTVYVRITDSEGNIYEQNRSIRCYDTEKPTLSASLTDGVLTIQGQDTFSGISRITVNGAEYYGCLPLDGDCYMTKIGFTNSSLCRYYEKVVLPDEPDIMVLLSYDRGKMRICKICGRKFVINGNRQYCSDHCSLIARRNATARRMRKARKNRDAM